MIFLANFRGLNCSNRSRKHRLLVSLSAMALAVTPEIGVAQTLVREGAADEVDTQERRLNSSLERARSLNKNAGYLKDGAFLLESAGSVVGGVWDLPAAPFEIMGGAASWAADKQQTSATLAAAEYFDQFKDVSNTDLSANRVRDVLRQNPEFADLGNTVLIDLVRQELVLARSDTATFQNRVEAARIKADNFSDEVLTDLIEIRLDQNQIAERIDSVDEAIAISGRLVLDSTEQLLAQGSELLEIQARQAQRYAERHGQVRSDIASSIRGGEDVKRAVNRDIRLSRINQNLLIGNRSLLTGIDRRARNIEGGVNFVAVQTFHGLNPEDQIKILQNSEHPVTRALFGSEDTPAKTLAVAEQMDESRSRKLQQDIVTGVQTTMGVLNGIDQIGQSLGWEFTKDKKYQDGMKILNAAAGLGVAYMTGNPMLAMNTLTSAFASPNSSPSAGESMILNQLGIMDRKLDRLLEGQQEILTSISKSTEIINRLQYETLYRLDSVDEQFGQLRTTAAATLQSISGYSAFFQQRSECFFLEKEVLAGFSGRFDYTELTRRLSIRPQAALRCADALDSVWKPTGLRDTALHPYIQMMSSVMTDQNGEYKASVLQFNDKQYSPLLRLLWKSFEIEFDDDQSPIGAIPFQLISSLSEPTASPDLLRPKVGQYQAKAARLSSLANSEISPAQLIRQFANLLATDSLIEMSDHYLRMIPLLDARTKELSDFKLYPREDLVTQDSSNLLVIENQLRLAHHLLNLAIAQQSLMSGDLLIPYLADFVLSTEHSDLRNDLLVAMEANSVLATNVLIYALDKELSFNRTLPSRTAGDGIELPSSEMVEGFVGNWANNLEVYDSLYGEPSSPSDNSCAKGVVTWACLFSDKIKISGRDLMLHTTLLNAEGDQENANEIRLSLPTPREMQNRQLTVRPDVVRIAQARQRLLHFADDYNVQGQLRDVTNNWALPKGFLMISKDN